MKTLRNKLIRLAHAKPDLRPDLLPLIREANNPQVYGELYKTAVDLAAVLDRMRKGQFGARGEDDDKMLVSMLGTRIEKGVWEDNFRYKKIT